MSSGLTPNSGPRLLNSTQQVVVRSIRLIEPAGLQFKDGGCSRPGADIHAEVIDVINGRVYLVPCSKAYAMRLQGQLQALLATDKTTDTEG